MPQNRRNFLKFISLGCIAAPLSSLSGCTHQKFYNPDQDIVLGAGRYTQNATLKHVLAIVNMQQNAKQQIAMDFLAHGILIDPKDKKRLVVFERFGTNAAEIDLNNHRVSKKISSSKQQNFCGHGVFNETGSTLYCTQISQQNNNGIIRMLDGRSLDAVGEFPSHGENPYHCKLVDNGATMVVLNIGSTDTKNSAPSITYIDIQSQQLKQTIPLSGQLLSSGSIKIANNGNLVVASSPIDTSPSIDKNATKTPNSGVSIRINQQAITLMSQPEAVIQQMAGQALSIAIDNKRNIAAVTHPEGNMVTFWSLENVTLIKAMSVAQPRGITLSLDGRSFIVSYDRNSRLVQINSKDLTADTRSVIQPSYITGTHLYNWSRILTEIMPANVYG